MIDDCIMVNVLLFLDQLQHNALIQFCLFGQNLHHLGPAMVRAQHPYTSLPLFRWKAGQSATVSNDLHRCFVSYESLILPRASCMNFVKITLGFK